MDLDFEKTMAMLNGESVENIELEHLTELDRIQITNALKMSPLSQNAPMFQQIFDRRTQDDNQRVRERGHR